MILGTGNDITDIRRIEKSLKRFNERFELRFFTEAERQKARSRANTAATYAKRFAAKEACAKALGTGVRGLSWQDMEVVNTPEGAPSLRLYGNAEKRLLALTPFGMRASVHLALTDEYPYAMAHVIISADPIG